MARLITQNLGIEVDDAIEIAEKIDGSITFTSGPGR
jgi:hypothetical protein